MDCVLHSVFKERKADLHKHEQNEAKSQYVEWISMVS